MAKKEEPAVSVARPVIAIEYNGTLYPTFQKAEGARAQADLITLLVPNRFNNAPIYDPYSSFVRTGERNAIDAMLKNAEKVHGILSRYMDAAKIETPSNV